jgi:predicted metal-dependent phosphotriesterase family hydrolase
MKCIKALRTGKDVQVGDIKRVDEKTAYNMVGSSWAYISKTEWKLSRGKKVVKETTEEVVDQSTEQVEKKPYKKGSKPEKKSK